MDSTTTTPIVTPNATNTVPVGTGTGNTAGSVNPTTTIDSSVLAPATPISYQTPNPTPIPSVANLETQTTPPLTETPQEGQESDLSTKLQGLNDQLVGKSAYQTQANTAAGVDRYSQQQSDLSSQLTNLKDQALAIPQQLQLDATGRGITSGGLAPVQTAALRNNSIQALGISAMLDATNGLLASAQTKANQAVAAKYDPIQEQIDAATKNLQLIQNDPKTTLADKNRAQAQLDVQNARAAQLATAKQNSTDVLNAAIAAAKNGADSSTLQAIQSAPDGITALGIAAKAGFANSNVSDLITKYPDAGIQPGDPLTVAQQKILASPTYKSARTAATLANLLTQSEIDKNKAAAGLSVGAGGVATGILPGTTGNAAIDVTSPNYSSSAVPGAGGLSQAAIDQAALSFAMTGTMPSMGLGSTGAAGQRRVAIQNRAAELDAGGNIQENKSILAANTKTLATQTAYLNTTERSLANAENGINQLTTAFQGKVNDQSMPIANVIANAVKYNLSPGDVASYKAGLQEVANEYTQVFSRGGQVTDSVRGKASSIIDGNISVADLKQVSAELQAQGAIVIQGAKDQVQNVQNTINSIISAPPSSTPAVGSTVSDTSNLPDGTIVNDGTNNYVIQGGKPVKQ